MRFIAKYFVSFGAFHVDLLIESGDRSNYIRMPAGNPMNFAEDAEAFYSMLIQFVELKEGHPHNYDFQWSGKDILYVRAALDELAQAQRAAFQERFRDYQIIKLISIHRQGSA